MFEKSLTTLIKGLRSHRGRDEARYIASRLQEIRAEVRSADMEVKAEAVLKLAYLRMLGYEVPSASFPVLEAMASNQYHVKHIGYLAAALCFSEDTDVLILATNLIKKDLHSAQPLDVLAALNGLSHVINPELAQHLSEDIALMLTHSKPRVRKRAVLVLHSAIVRYPDLLERTWERLRDLLCDSDQGVVTATVNVVCELARRNPEPFVPLSPQLFEILTHTSNNWLLIKVVKLFGALARVEPRLVRKLLRPISQIISTTPAMSVLYGCIHTAIIGHMLEGAGSEELAVRCIDNLGQFLRDSDQNLKYIALLALTKLVPTHPALVAQHEDTILAAIRHPDMTIQLRALELLCQLASTGSLRTILDTLLHYVEETEGASLLRGASQALQDTLENSSAIPTSEAVPVASTDERASFRSQVAESILDLGSTDHYAHVPDMAWYLSVLQRLIRCVDLGIAQHVANQVIDILEHHAPVRPEACAHFEPLLLSGREELFDRTSPESEWLRAGAWACSEYPELIHAHARVCRALLPTSVRTLPARTVAVCIQSAMKLCAYDAAMRTNRWGTESRAELEALISDLKTQLGPLVHHRDSDVHERAQESLQLFTLLQQGLASSQEPTPTPRHEEPGPEMEDHAWDDTVHDRPRAAPRALHLLEPLYFTREDDAAEDGPPTLPPSFDLHTWIVPQGAWPSILEHIEPAPKPKARRTEVPAPPEPVRSSRRKDPSRPKKSKSAVQAQAPPPRPADDDDLHDIPIVRLDLSDLTPQPKPRDEPYASDTPTAAPTVQPKMVTRKKKSRPAS